MKKFITVIILLCFSCSFPIAALDFPQSIDVKKVDVSIDLSPQDQRLSVICILEFCKNPDFDGKFYFEPLLDKMKVTNEKGKSVLEDFNPASGVIRLIPLSDGNHTLFFEYSGTCRNEKIPSGRCLFTKDFLQFDDAGFWYPKSPLGADWHDGILTVTAPKDFVTIGPGRLINEVAKGERVTRVFATEAPCPRGMALFGGKYVEESIQAGKVRISIFVKKDFSFLKKSEWLDYVKRVVEAYSERFGFFPCSELRIVQLPLFPEYVGRGISPNCIMIGGDKPFALSPLSHGIPHFVAHEILHQYFGATCFGNPLDGGLYLIEGTTEAVSAFVVGDWASPSAFLQAKARWKQSTLEIPPEEDLPIEVASFTSPHYGTLAYSKFPLFLSALRSEIGDAKMREIECKFINDFRYKGFPSLKDFLGIINEETGGDSKVHDLVRAWVGGIGLPGPETASYPISLFVRKISDGNRVMKREDSFQPEIRVDLDDYSRFFRTTPQNGLGRK